MTATIMHEPGDVRIENVADSSIELLPDVMEGRIEPGRVFDRIVKLEGVPDGYRDMNERNALKVMVRP